MLVVEININEMNQTNIQKLFLENAMYLGDETLKENLSGDMYELVETRLKQLLIPTERVEKFRPWYLATLIEQMQLQKLGYYPIYGIDYYFLKKSEGKKKILELETAEFQISLFNKLSSDEQELYLYYTLTYLDQLEKEIEKLKNAWLAGDYQTVELLMLSGSLLGDPRLLPLYEKLFYERNKNMASKIEEFLKTSNTYFVVVGAGHLVGKDGIIELLKKKGYSVTQL
jgi:uncharacterized protein YbaP (TraB family)